MMMMRWRRRSNTRCSFHCPGVWQSFNEYDASKLRQFPPLSVPAFAFLGLHRKTNMGSKLENAMESLIKVFHTYSSKEGDKYKLSKAEMKCLLQGELGAFLAASKDPLVVEKIMSDLDENRDGEVDFQEFVVLVAALTVACNDFFVENMKK